MDVVTAILSCVTAHKEVCQAGYIQRDVSARSVLLYPNVPSDYVGLLNDWELSRAYTDEKTDVTVWKHHFDRTGTWQFMSVHALVNPRRIIMTQDDLESFFHVMLYLATRFLPHNCIRGIDQILSGYFDDYTDSIRGPTSGPAKDRHETWGDRHHSKRAPSNTFDKFLEFYIPRKPGDSESTQDADTAQPMTLHPINSLIIELLGWFKAFYTLDRRKQKGTNAAAPVEDSPALQPALFLLRMKPRMSANPHPFASASSASSNRPTPPAAGNDDDVPERAQKLESHDAMEDLLLRYLTEKEWPAGDELADMKPENRVRLPEDDIPPPSTIVDSKRVLEDSLTNPSPKRVRRKAGV